MKAYLPLTTFCTALLLSACQPATDSATPTAPGAPGVASTWAYAGKQGIGSSYEQYHQGAYSDQAATGVVSKVWFSIAQGVLTETMSGLIHQAQLREMQFVVKGAGFVDEEKTATVSSIDYLYKDAAGRPLSLAYKVLNKAKNGQYEIEKHIFTDPSGQSLVVRSYFRPLADNLQLFVYLDPALGNTGSNDKAYVKNNMIHAVEGSSALTLISQPAFKQASTGFVGVSDGLTELKTSQTFNNLYQNTGETAGNVAALAELPAVKKGESGQFDLVIGFGDSPDNSEVAAQNTFKRGLDTVLAEFNGLGDAIGWQDYLQSLPQLATLADTAMDNGKLLYTSAMVLKAQEDKTHAGALIASLSNPWGDVKSAEQSQTGYKAVWPRDFYQVAMAMLALGDEQSPKVAFEYLTKVQVSDKTPGYVGAPGWFLQKTHVDGTLEWVGIQLDQTAMPIMLGWRLWQQGLLSETELKTWYSRMLKPAADFLAKGGQVKLDWNDIALTPPSTQQERWEEQGGYSPSTIAAVISGLVVAADIAKLSGDTASAELYLQKADEYSSNLEAKTFTTQGTLKQAPSDGQYYLRINSNDNPNDQSKLADRNGISNINESDVVDGGFLELVRYGVRSADHQAVLATLGELDDQNLPDALRVKYEFSFAGIEGKLPGWRRYGLDGYGEDTETSMAYAKGPNDANTAGQRGRVWPIFSGERGHYELALLQSQKQPLSAETIQPLRHNYVQAMEQFANEGMMLPEQVWDNVGNNSVYQYSSGEGTNGATPLAWSHAEYIKLLRSLKDQKVWDRYQPVEQRYSSK
ncbi:glucan 1,4-alpha-glucosidase [Rheinheimera sp.]|uniref:glucan 1,4-alpha-glucosidase n=1 Tax=Rheinheimera sp. TaxID=1869214 RepID=UPI0027B93372|nr:glucan 1,4-alpha-glucosidase [Rheinheimera sp.]